MQNVTDLISLAKPGTEHFFLKPLSCERVRENTVWLTLCVFCGGRLIHMPDFLERRPEYREFHHSVYDGGDDEEVGAAD